MPSSVFQYSSPWWARWFKATHKTLSFSPEYIVVTNWQGENSQLNWDCVSTIPDINSITKFRMCMARGEAKTKWSVLIYIDYGEAYSKTE
jgi:hypothetical protein